jgi:hypothetical protein
MNLQDLLNQAENDGTLDQIAQQLGIDKDVARQGMAQLAPSIARGMQRNTDSGGSLTDLIGMLGGAQVGQAATAGMGGGAGNDILGQIFGNKDVSRNVAGHAAEQTGIDSSLLRRMLPLIASAVVMLISRRMSQGGGTTPTGLPGAGTGANAAPQGGSGIDILTSLLDQNHDGSAVDDLLNLARKFF